MLRFKESFEAAAGLALFMPHATDMLLLQLPTSTLTRDLASLLKQLLVGGWVGGWVRACVRAWVRGCVGGRAGGRAGGRGDSTEQTNLH